MSVPWQGELPTDKESCRLTKYWYVMYYMYYIMYQYFFKFEYNVFAWD
jgi:hypothetical protein